MVWQLRCNAKGIRAKTFDFSSRTVLVRAGIYKLATGVRMNVRAMGKYRGATQRATNVTSGGGESFPSFCPRIHLFSSPRTIHPYFLLAPPVFHVNGAAA